MAPDPTRLHPREILRFWLPLAATWVMMSVEGPYLAAVIARLPEPEPNLAAFGVSFSVALILEAPVIMLMAAATALVRDRASLAAVRRFSLGLSWLVTLAAVVAVLPPVYRVLADRVLDLPPEVARLTHPALVWLLPWPGVIGYRRFYQGVLIRSGQTRRVGYGTGVRLVAMAATAQAGFHLGVGGATVGASALTAGVLAEAVACRLMVAPSVTRLRAGPAVPGPGPSQAAIARFYTPLALSAVLTLAIHPMATFFLARAREPVMSMAVFPVVRALVFVFSCLGLSYQEVIIALLGDRWQGRPALARFGAWLGLGAAGGLAAVALTPASRLWFEGVSGLTPDLARLAWLPTALLVPVPALTVSLSFLRALHVQARRTRPITVATVAEVAVIGTGLWVGIAVLDGVGVVVAAAAILAGRVCSNLTLLAHGGRIPPPA